MLSNVSLWGGLARDHIHQFWRSEDGSQSIEAMLMIPIYVWCFLATYVFFDAYRLQSVNAKVGYTIGDIMSRQTNAITPEFMDSMHFLQQSMTNVRTPARLRVAAFRYDAGTDALELIWSEGRGTTGLSQSRLNTMRSAIPEMADDEWGVLVQTSVDYDPVYAAGITYTSFTDFVVQSLRVAQLCYHPTNLPGTQDPTDMVCG